VAILARPGRRLAEGSPVSLKSSLGKGYKVVVRFDQEQSEAENSVTPAIYGDLLATIRQHAQDATIMNPSLCSVTFALKTKDTTIVQQILADLENEERRGNISGYEVNSTSLEDIYLDLMGKERELQEDGDQGNSSDERLYGSDLPTLVTSADPANPHPTPLDLTPARPTSLLYQSLTIFYKRLLILRRSWLSPLLALVIACCGACIPLIFMNDRVSTCAITFRPTEISPLWLPLSQVGSQARLASAVPLSNDKIGQPINDDDVIPRIAPPYILDVLGQAVVAIPTVKLVDRPSFMQNIAQNVRTLSTGGIWVDTSSRQAVLAYEATNNLNGPTMLNLVSNVLFTSVGGADGRTIVANFMPFPLRVAQGPGALKWVRLVCGKMLVILITPP
jgi:ATP-binding cassette subfamily A (ABC1) protein 3